MPGGYISTIDDFLGALRNFGATTSELGIESGEPFSVDAHVLVSEGHKIWVFEYPDEDARRAESETILMDGWSVNHTPVEWIASPHYWLQGRIIALYLGDDPEAITTFTFILGPELDLRRSNADS